MSLKLAARLVILDATKIADLQENDTTAHIEDFSAFLPPETLCILLSVQRITGTGNFVVYPRSGTRSVYISSEANIAPLPIKNREMKWANTAANDDWDVFLYGYFVQRRTD